MITVFCSIHLQYICLDSHKEQALIKHVFLSNPHSTAPRRFLEPCCMFRSVTHTHIHSTRPIPFIWKVNYKWKILQPLHSSVIWVRVYTVALKTCRHPLVSLDPVLKETPLRIQMIIHVLFNTALPMSTGPNQTFNFNKCKGVIQNV